MQWPTCLLVSLPCLIVSLPLIAQLVTLFDDHTSRTRNSDGCLLRFLRFFGPLLFSLAGFAQELSDRLQPLYPMFCWCRQPPPHMLIAFVIGVFFIAWPRSGRALWLLLGRGQVALFGFSLAEVKSWSAGSVWPSSSRVIWGLLGRVHVYVRGFSNFSCAVHTVSSGCRGPTGSRPGCCGRLRSEWSLFFCSPVQFCFQLSTAELAPLSVGRLAHLSVAAMCTATDSTDMSLGDGVSFIVSGHAVFSPDCCVPFLVGGPFRVLRRLNSYFSDSICPASGVFVDLTSAESVSEVLVSDRCRLWLRVLLAIFTLVFFCGLELVVFPVVRFMVACEKLLDSRCFRRGCCMGRAFTHVQGRSQLSVSWLHN